MESLQASLSQFLAALQLYLPVTGYLVLGLWVVHLLNWSVGYRLNLLGIIPRTPRGLIGICFAPFLHGDVWHLLFNSLPLLMLSTLMLMQIKSQFVQAMLLIIVFSGGLTWLFGRRAIHVGASGVVLGQMGFLFALVYFQPSLDAIVLVAVMLYYFGGLLVHLLPVDPTASWEGHVFGFLSGGLVAFLLLG